MSDPNAALEAVSSMRASLKDRMKRRKQAMQGFMVGAVAAADKDKDRDRDKAGGKRPAPEKKAVQKGQFGN